MSVTFLNPIFLTLLSLEIIVILLYLIKPKRLKLKVPSLLLWERILREEPLGRWFKKLPKNLILILQILTVFFLVFFLSKPILSFQWKAGNPVVVILDSSASMGARDLAPSRFERAKMEIIRFSKEVRNKIALVVSKDKPMLLISSGRSEDIERTLSKEELFLGEGNLNYAISYVENLFKNPYYEVHIFTDGSEKIEILGNSPHKYYIHVIGKDGNNVGIIDGRVFQKNSKESQIYLKIGNFSKSFQNFNLRILKDKRSILTTNISLSPQEIRNLSFDLPLLTGKIEAILEIKDDLLDDNKAYFYVPIFSPKVLIISMGNPFLEKAVKSILSAQVEIRRDILNVDFNKYDFCIFDGLIPYSEISGNFLFIGGYPGLNPQKIEKIGKVKILSWEEHPILSFVQPYGISVDNAYLFKDERLRPLIYSDKGPIGFYYEKDNMKSVILSFDLLSTPWIYHDSFPVFIYNLLKYFLSYDPQRKIGELRYTKSPGFYEDSKEKKIFAVNIFSEKESNIIPKIKSFESGDKKTINNDNNRVYLDLSIFFLILTLITILLEILIYLGGRVYS